MRTKELLPRKRERSEDEEVLDSNSPVGDWTPEEVKAIRRQMAGESLNEVFGMWCETLLQVKEQLLRNLTMAELLGELARRLE